MAEVEERGSLGELVLVVSGAAALAAILSTLAQELLVGDVHAGVTGAVAGAVSALAGSSYYRKRHPAR